MIDDQLMKETPKATGISSTCEAVELGLRTLLSLKRQEVIKHFRGKLSWEGDLDVMRIDH